MMRDNIIKEYTIENITLLLLFLEEISGAEFEEMYALCSRERREKADRIKPGIKGKQSRGAGYLLSVLKKRFSIEEEPVISSKGKPVFKKNTAVQFSISHSRDTVLLAFGDKPLGADIEDVKKANLKLAARFFTKEEYIRISEQEEEKQSDAFCRIWTGKEAVAKAAGDGLSLVFEQFSVLEKTAEVSGKKYELYQRKLENKGQNLWISAAQLITDSAGYYPI